MFSPVYTPFCDSEVATVLKMTPDSYRYAVKAGALERSISHPERNSAVIAMHNLIDITRFAVYQALGWPNERVRQFKFPIDRCLDALCTMIEFSNRRVISGDPITLASDMLSFLERPEDASEEQFAAIVAKAWITSHWRLVDVLKFDMQEIES